LPDTRVAPWAEPKRRLRHSQFLIYLLGGVLGSGLNLAVTWLLHALWGRPLVAFFWGTLANQLFHHAYYQLVYFNDEIRMRTLVPVQFLLYVLVAGAAVAELAVLHAAWGVPYGPAVILCIATLSIASVLVIRLSTFASATDAEVEYREMHESFYDDQTDATKVSRFRAWYHRSRYERLTELVAEHYRPGMQVADLGCGNCWWNTRGIPVVGVDVNENMLRWAKRNGRLADYRVCADVSQPGLPEGAFDIVVMSEVLEHLLNGPDVLATIRRLLKPDGTLLLTVPYDVFLGPFFVLFNLNCLYQGYVRDSAYHRHRCGHVNHFTKSRLRRTLTENGFRIDRLFVVNGLLLYSVSHPVR
jgi:2-polyprenyl-3-methyl-5-hydroxy-6-metoxy-1,4-benzoquinol methylase